MRSLPLAAVLAIAAGCASVPMATAEQDRAAKEFRTTAGRSNLYVFRDESFGGAVKLSLQLDGRVLGDTGPKTFHLIAVDPGKHLLVSKAENDDRLEFTAEAGKNVYVWQEVKMGLLSARNRLEIVGEADAQRRILECSLARNDLEGVPLPPPPAAPAAVPGS